MASIGGNFEINADGSSTLSGLASFEGLESLASIGGNFEINAEYSLNALTSFKGLGNLASISGNFEINGAPDSFEGLENLTSIGGNFEVNGSSLTSFKGLDKLKQINGDFKIYRMASNSSSFEGLSNLESIGGDFNATPSRDSGYGYTIAIYIKIENYLSNLTTVGGNMKIRINTYNDSSEEIFNVNFSKLESIGGSLSLNQNDGYCTLAFPSLQAIGGECAFDKFNLIDFPNLESVNGALEISNVNSIGTLDKLKSVGDITISGCEDLYDFCNWIPVLTDYNGTFLVTECGYNPTKYQILNGECSQTPAD